MFVSYYWAVFDSLARGNSIADIDMSQVNCFSPQCWFVIVSMVSSLLMTFNASIGVFIYCVMCRNFREELLRHMRHGQSVLRAWIVTLKPEQHPRFEMVVTTSNVTDQSIV
jgi:hypothetical protein